MKAICVINTSGNYGGAEKRIVSLFEFVRKERDDIILIINRSLFELMQEKGILSPGARISIIDIPFDKTSMPGKGQSTGKQGMNKKKEPGQDDSRQI